MSSKLVERYSAFGSPHPPTIFGRAVATNDSITSHCGIARRKQAFGEFDSGKPGYARRLQLIERLFNKLKHWRRVATRCDKLAANYLAVVKLASIAFRCAL
jgi:transposase